LRHAKENARVLEAVSLRLAGLSALALHLMSRAQLREFMALFAIGSALTVVVFFLALWLLPDKPFTTFLFPRFP
jgi:type II secretory pathway component PulM